MRENQGFQPIRNAKIAEPIIDEKFSSDYLVIQEVTIKLTFLTLIEKKDAKLNAVYYAVTLEDIAKD